MHVDVEAHRTMIRAATRPVRRPWRPMLAELAELGGGKAEVLRHSERPWASITFSGSRHTITLRFAGRDAAEAGEAYIAALPEHEFAIPGQLVVEAAVVAVDHALLPEPSLTVEAELLLLEDA